MRTLLKADLRILQEELSSNKKKNSAVNIHWKNKLEDGFKCF